MSGWSLVSYVILIRNIEGEGRTLSKNIPTQTYIMKKLQMLKLKSRDLSRKERYVVYFAFQGKKHAKGNSCSSTANLVNNRWFYNCFWVERLKAVWMEFTSRTHIVAAKWAETNRILLIVPCVWWSQDWMS